MKRRNIILTIAVITLSLLTGNIQAADEGIKVHGHWSFEIYNADGSFDRKVEFDNALTNPYGGGTLINLLNKSATVSLWEITVYSNTEAPCSNVSGDAAPCYMLEAGQPATNPYDFATLTIASENPGQHPTKLILSGSFVVASDRTNPTVNLVETSTVTVGANGDSQSFTAKTLPAPIALQPNQQVLVTVEISFS